MRVKQIKQNIKGFTIVEILAAVIILGVLSLIAIVSVSSVLDRAEENHYKTQKDTLIMAAKSYVQDNRNLLPKNVGDSRIITLKELQDAKYIGKVVDRSKKPCDEAAVTIFRYSKSDYSYSAYLKCGSKIIGNESGEVAGPVINLKSNNDYQNPYFTYEILGNGVDDGKIISYNYQIYKDTVLVYDSGSISVSKAATIAEKKVSLKEYVPGNFSIVFTAVNHYGGTTTEKINNKEYQDPDGPECGEVTPKRNQWDGLDEVVISIKCVDRSGSGCARDIFTQYFTTDAEINSIMIVDNLGNKTSCSVDTYIDMTPPNKPIITNPYENTWSNREYKLTLKSSDATSGIAYYEYRYPNSENASEREWNIYEGSKRDESSLVDGEFIYETPLLTEERNEYIEIRACDQAGNCSDAAQSMIKIDKTSPSVSNLVNSSNGNWVNQNVSLSFNQNDTGGSGILRAEYSYDQTTWRSDWTTSDLKATNFSSVWSSDINKTVYVRTIDEAGNVSSSLSTTIKIDKTPPTCSLKLSGTWNNAGFYSSNVVVSFSNKSDDGESGLIAFGMGTNASPNYNSSTQQTQGATNGITWYGYVKDGAGNTNVCNSGSFKVLLKPPVITFNLSGATSIATCTDGNTGQFIQQFTKNISNSDLTHYVTCSNSAGQTTSNSYTYKAVYVCNKNCTSCDTCHGSCCGGTRPCRTCAYSCNCHDYCCGGYYNYTM